MLFQIFILFNTHTNFFVSSGLPVLSGGDTSFMFAHGNEASRKTCNRSCLQVCNFRREKNLEIFVTFICNAVWRNPRINVFFSMIVWDTHLRKIARRLAFLRSPHLHLHVECREASYWKFFPKVEQPLD